MESRLQGVLQDWKAGCIAVADAKQVFSGLFSVRFLAWFSQSLRVMTAQLNLEGLDCLSYQRELPTYLTYAQD